RAGTANKRRHYGTRVALQPRSALASHAERQRFGAGPCADATERAAELRRASVTAGIDTEVVPRQHWLNVAPARSWWADKSGCGANENTIKRAATSLTNCQIKSTLSAKTNLFIAEFR